MIRRLAAAYPLVLLHLMDGPANAQPAEGPTPGTWIVDAGDKYCSITRTTQDPVPVTFSVRIVPGNSTLELLMHSPQWRRPPLDEGDQARIILQPSGTSFDRPARGGRLAQGESLVAILGLPETFLDAFAQSSEIQVNHDDEIPIRFSFRQADRAMPALRTCINVTLRDWGVDQAALEALREQPVETRPWLTSNDYPDASLYGGEAGQLAVRLSVDSSGRVTDCTVVASSGHDRLDEETCDAAVRRGRYSPAIDASGNPVEVRIIRVVRFDLMY